MHATHHNEKKKGKRSPVSFLDINYLSLNVDKLIEISMGKELNSMENAYPLSLFHNCS